MLLFLRTKVGLNAIHSYIGIGKCKLMKKEGLVEAVMKAAKLETKKQAQAVVEAVFDTVMKTLGRGEEVGVTGFGTFRTVKTKARMGINPKTGEKLQIPAMTKPKFKAGKELKDAVR